MTLDLLQTFLAVATAGSFATAARQLGVQRSTISRNVGTLERELGSILFERTTRRVSLTADGERLRRELAPNLNGLTETLKRFSGQVERPSGVLRLMLSNEVVAIFDPDFLARFCERFPDVQLDIRVAHYRELAHGGFDVAVCYAPERMPDSSLVGRKLLDLELRIFATPAYLEQAGSPRTIADTALHPWVWIPGVPLPSPLPRQRTRARVTCNDPLTMLQAVLAGLGLGLLQPLVIGPLVASGVLAPVLPRFSVRSGGLYLLHAPSRPLPAKIAAFSEHVEALLQRGNAPRRPGADRDGDEEGCGSHPEQPREIASGRARPVPRRP